VGLPASRCCSTEVEVSRGLAVLLALIRGTGCVGADAPARCSELLLARPRWRRERLRRPAAKLSRLHVLPGVCDVLCGISLGASASNQTRGSRTLWKIWASARPTEIPRRPIQRRGLLRRKLFLGDREGDPQQPAQTGSITASSCTGRP
jgi:hypothetical protein